MRTVGGIGIAILAVCAVLLGNWLAGSAEAAEPPPPALSAVPIPPGQIEAAVDKLDAIVADVMARSGVPGVAVSVVHGDEIVYAKGFGVRRIGSSASVDENTVFQLASVSKPLGASVVARLAERKGFSWDDPVVKHLPWFRLSDPWVTRKVTIEDLYAHRSGLPAHAGDLLEDVGFGRATIMRRLRLYELEPFRAGFGYTNFGLTAGALAAARSAGKSWPALSRQMIYRPLGMNSTSATFAGWRRAKNRADMHVLRGGTWKSIYQRDADAQAPAGAANSSALDMARWMRMALNEGRAGDKQVLRPESILNLYTPRLAIAPPATPDSRSSFYALGMFVGDDSTGRVRLSHSGASARGASTSLNLLPSARLGITVLTNGVPLGVAEAISASFLDLATLGRVERDYFEVFRADVEPLLKPNGRLAGQKRPRGAKPPRPLRHYTGTYRNRLFGPARVVLRKGRLLLKLGPKLSAPLTHWRGNTFAYRAVAETAAGLAAVDFGFRRGRPYVRTMRIEDLDQEGYGRFVARGVRPG